MTSQNQPPSRVRIGELSRRTGVSDHALRAWERRYHLLEPVRSEGGYRLYSSDDERRVRTMVELMDRGVSAAEAAALARAAAPQSAADGGHGGVRGLSDESLLARVRTQLATAVELMDEALAQQAVDELLGALTVETALRDVVLPFLHDLGERWERGQLSVAQEHFASQVLRGRVASLARGMGSGVGPKALLACAPGELHDIGLLVFAVVLGRLGWSVTFLGADTPVESLAEALDAGRYELVVVSASDPGRFVDVAEDVSRIAGRARCYLAGPGATDGALAATGAARLEGDPVTAAMILSSR